MITTVFVECVSCGIKLDLAEGDIDDRSAARLARAKGWTVKGFWGAKATRCGGCRRKGRRHHAAEIAGRLGKRAGRSGGYGPPRHP